MAFLRSILYPDASEFISVECGGVLGIFNGLERPTKYEPESRTMKYFGLLNPLVSILVTPFNAGSPGDLDGDYVYEYVEADSKANQGQGRPSGPPLDSTGVEVTVANGYNVVTLPATARNPETDQFWIYRSLQGGSWPTLGRIATVDVGTTSYIDTGDTPDFLNYALDVFVDTPPTKPYAFTLHRRLLMWGEEPHEGTFTLTSGSATAIQITGDDLDEGIIGAVLYPEGGDRGYVVTGFTSGSPDTLTLQDAFVGATQTVDCRLCYPTAELAWSDPDNYESFPAANYRYVARSNGKTPSGAYPIGPMALLFTVPQTFGLTFDINGSPAEDFGIVQLLSNSIGCVSNRTIQDIGDMLLWLAEGGIAASAGGPPQIVSDDIQDFFDTIYKEDTGRVRDAFAINWPVMRRYICFVPTGDDTIGCSTAIVIFYNSMPGEPKFRFGFYDFGIEMTSAALERDDAGDEYILLGDANGMTWQFGVGYADGPESGTLSGVIDSVNTSPASIVDNDAQFDTEGLGLKGMMLTIRRVSDGTEERFLISSNSGTEVYPDGSWGTEPEPADEYWIGGIPSRYRTGWANLGAEDRVKKLDRVGTTFEERNAGEIAILVRRDMNETPIDMEAALDVDGEEGDENIDMTADDGRSSKKLSSRKAFFVSLEWYNARPNQHWRLRSAFLNYKYGSP
jgi:hypothetical protein